jgi:hypothetical protein
VSHLARALFIHHQHFVTFIHEDGVEPTNRQSTFSDTEIALRAG